MKKFAVLSSILAVFCLVAVSCKNTATQDAIMPEPPAGTAPMVYPVNDSLPGTNRAIHKFNHLAYDYVICPLARGWEFLMPPTIRTGLYNFTENLKFPQFFVANSLQGKFKEAGTETLRFGVNSTAGLAGTINAAEYFGIPENKASFADVFDHYNMGHGTFLNLPILGPSTSRNALATILDLPFNIMSYFPSHTIPNTVSACGIINEASGNAKLFQQTMASNFDSMAVCRAYYMMKDHARSHKPVMYPETLGPDGEFQPADPTFNVLSATLSDPDYYYDSITRKAKLADGYAMPYQCWPKKNSSNLVIVLGGIGGHRLSNTMVFLSEIFSKNNASVIAVSSTFTHDYISNLPTPVPPGNLCNDAAVLADVLKAVINDYKSRYKLADNCKVSVVGYSLGGANALYLADMDFQNTLPDGLSFDRFVAINPQINSQTGMQKIDEMFNIPQSWPAEKRNEIIANSFDKLMVMYSGNKEAYMQCPITKSESEFLIGMSMHFSLSEAVISLENNKQNKHKNPDFSDDNLDRAWINAMHLSSQDYLNRYVIPFYGVSAQEIADNSNIKNLYESLANNPKVYLVHTDNDFLLEPGDLDWMKNCFKKRLVIFKGMGHVGEITTLGFDVIMSQIVIRQ